METTIYSVDFFINKFSAIPEEDIGKESAAKRCALYHCAGGDMFRAYNSIEGRALGVLLGAEDKSDAPYELVFDINDGRDHRYKHLPTPKARILAALYDIKKAQQPEVKERIVYVTVDQPVRELQKQELAQN